MFKAYYLKETYESLPFLMVFALANYLLIVISNYNTFKACLIKSSTVAAGLLAIIFSNTFSAFFLI